MRHDWPDLCGGLVLAAVGAGAASYAFVHYDLGSLRRMGPGAFPLALGATLFGLGLVVALPALRRVTEAPRIDARATVAVLAALLIVGFGLTRIGLVAATALAVLVATIPAPAQGWVWRVVLAAAVTAITVIVFSFGLRMTLPLWPRLP